MLLTLVASWWVASSHAKRRNVGFWLFTASNILWTAWGLHADAYALVLLQMGLVVLNIRGLKKTDGESG